jgi:DNA repair protein RadC
MKLALNSNALQWYLFIPPVRRPQPSTERTEETYTEPCVCIPAFILQVLDHIIIGNIMYYSFADEGVIKTLYRRIQNET